VVGAVAADLSAAHHVLDGPAVQVIAHRGRGLHLIRAVTDGLEMRRVNPHGFAISMIKTPTGAARRRRVAR
jgi:hypothetical protein